MAFLCRSSAISATVPAPFKVGRRSNVRTPKTTSSSVVPSASLSSRLRNVQSSQPPSFSNSSLEYHQLINKNNVAKHSNSKTFQQTRKYAVQIESAESILRRIDPNRPRGKLARSDLSLRGIAGSYAHAWFTYAKEKNAVDVVEKDLENFNASLYAYPNVAKILLHNDKSQNVDDVRTMLYEAAYKLSRSDITPILLLSLFDGGKFSEFPKVLETFQRLSSESKGFVDVVITLARPPIALIRDLGFDIEAYIKERQKLESKLTGEETPEQEQLDNTLDALDDTVPVTLSKRAPTRTDEELDLLQAEIKATLEKQQMLPSGKKPRFLYQVDETIDGGWIAQIEDLRFDNSWSRKLDEMRRNALTTLQKQYTDMASEKPPYVPYPGKAPLSDEELAKLNEQQLASTFGFEALTFKTLLGRVILDNTTDSPAIKQLLARFPQTSKDVSELLQVVHTHPYVVALRNELKTNGACFVPIRPANELRILNKKEKVQLELQVLQEDPERLGHVVGSTIFAFWPLGEPSDEMRIWEEELRPIRDLEKAVEQLAVENAHKELEAQQEAEQ